jgi:hypothetical protein
LIYQQKGQHGRFHIFLKFSNYSKFHVGLYFWVASFYQKIGEEESIGDRF